MIRAFVPHFSIARIFGVLEASPERQVLSKSESCVTARELLQQVSAIRMTMREAGLSRGDVVAVSAERTSESIAAMLACWAEGFVPFPLDYRQDKATLSQLLDGVRAKGCYFGELLDATPILHRVPYLRWKALSGRQIEGCICVNTSSSSQQIEKIDADQDEAVILHSAGVCAAPHAMRHSSEVLQNQYRAIIAQLVLRDTDAVYYSGTFSSPSAFALVFCGALTCGAVIRLEDPTEIIEPVRSFETERPVILFAEARDQRLGAEKLLLYKGARSIIIADTAVTDERVALIQRATDAHVFCACACVEACGFLTINSSPGLWPSESAGVAIPGIELVCLDEKKQPVNDSAIGSVAFRLTSAQYDGLDKNSQWTQTGDWGYFDESGRLQIVGSERSVIWKAGFPVLANQVEEALRSVSGVEDAWVFGIPDREVGQEVTAQITISDPSLTVSALLECLATKLPAYMIPHEPLFVQELPSTPSGKKIRRTGRSSATSGTQKQVVESSMSGPNLAPVVRVADPESASDF